MLERMVGAVKFESYRRRDSKMFTLRILLACACVRFTSGHFVNSSLVPVPSAIRNYKANATEMRILYDAGDRGCFCKSLRDWTICMGRECVEVPRQLTVPNQRLRVEGTVITSIGRADFADYGDLVELQLDGNALERIEDGTFENMFQLANLSISSNRLFSIVPGAFRGLFNLQYLRLTKNRFLHLSDVIPSLVPLQSLQYLILNHNAFGRIEPDDFVPLNGSTLQTLELGNCDLKQVDSMAFKPLKHLKKLRLSGNTMPDDNLRHLVENMRETRVRALDLSQLRFTSSQVQNLLGAIANTDMEELSLRKNTLTRLKSKTFPVMLYVRELDLSACGIISIENSTFSQLPLLRKLNLAQNALGVIPPAVRVLTQLEWLSLSGNSGGYDYGAMTIEDGNFETLTNLVYLDLSYNRIGQVIRGAFRGLTQLKELSLRNTSLYRIMDGSFESLPSLEVLRLESSVLAKIEFGRSLFQGLGNLRRLYLDKCKISFTDQEAIFAESPYLEHLSLRENLIVSFGSGNPFLNATGLVQVDLAKNQIRGWDAPIFQSSPRLSAVCLSENQITSITGAMLQDFSNLSEVDLLKNPLECDCNMQPLRRHAIEHLVLDDNHLVIKADHCSSPDRWRYIPVTDFLLALDEAECAAEDIVLDLFDASKSFKVISIILPLLSLFGVAWYLIYRSRWMIRYYFFRKRFMRANSVAEASEAQLMEPNYLYDAFVSYSSVDQAFVARLVSMLENWPPHFKLCIYERDFTAGNVLNDCIMQSIASSRKVVLVISENFIHSHWCMWEMHLAQHALLEEKRSGLILVVVGKFLDRATSRTSR